MSFLTVAVVLVTVFLMLTLDVRRRVRQAAVHTLSVGQSLFASVESRRQRDMVATVSTLAENPTLKAALDTWQTEQRNGGGDADEIRRTIQVEADKIAARIAADVLAVTDVNGRVMVSAGPRASAWRPGTVVRPRTPGTPVGGDVVAVLPLGAFRTTGVPLRLGDALIGSLELGRDLDAGYVRELADLARGHSAILIGDRVQATTLSAAIAADLPAAIGAAPSTGIVRLGGQTWAVQHEDLPPARFVTLASVDAAASDATRSALAGLALVGAAALVLAAIGSVWLARTITRPIDRLSASVVSMTAARRFDTPLPATGSSRELDALTATFNDLIRSVSAAEAETQAAYLGAIRALAAALDARDPYTAGHSERVSALSVEMGRVLMLSEQDLSTLRLGALLHDIGKIGVPDDVLGKPSTLTPREFELIRAHPVIGARILRSIPFLASHLPIVELHHERPDGHGYPYGLSGTAIPLAARIVHVADAYDAMTSARAYRSARSSPEAIAELRRGTGEDFDPVSVRALLDALPRLSGAGTFDLAAYPLVHVLRSQAS